MRIFDFHDYRAVIRTKIEASDRRGHGQYKKIAEFLSIPSSLLSQIMSGQRELTIEAASLMCDYLGFNDTEAEYFITLVEYERSGNPSLRARKKRKLEQLAIDGSQVEKRIKHDRKLSEEQKKVFYSQWYYSAIRLMSAIDGKNSVDSLSDSLRLPRHIVAQAVTFLVETGLCVEQKGKVRIGPMSTHVGNDSSMVVRHHMNWRMKVMSQLAQPRDHEIAFTGPAVISQKACIEIKKKLLSLIEEWSKEVDRAHEETLVCLNIDWFEID